MVNLCVGLDFFPTSPFFWKLSTSLASVLSFSPEYRPVALSAPLCFSWAGVIFSFNSGFSWHSLTGSAFILVLYILIKWPPCVVVLVTPVGK